MKKLTKLMLVLAQLGLVGAAQAASVSLSQIPVPQSVMLGNNVSFAVNVDFSDVATIGGRFQVSYDTSILGNLGVATFSPGSITGVTIYTPTVSTGLINNLGFAGSVSGFHTLGTLTFSTLNTGSANLVSAAYSDPFYRFRNSPTGSSFLTVTYGGATTEVTAVPAPAALWLMASGLSALGLGLRRRRA